MGRHVQDVAKIVADRIDRPDRVGLERVEDDVGDHQRRAGVSGDGRAAVGILAVQQVHGVMDRRDVGRYDVVPTWSTRAPAAWPNRS